VIKSKAVNENQKVNEVAVINSINSEGVAEELQRELGEVEVHPTIPTHTHTYTHTHTHTHTHI